jgi:F-type H+-transporting ATPase subunit gamma
MELEITPKNHDFMIFEPSAEVVLDKLYEQIVQALFLQALYELKASEYSSRMIAMKNATDSADKIIKNLTLDLNKARQAAITQEIAELAGAQAAMN